MYIIGNYTGVKYIIPIACGTVRWWTGTLLTGRVNAPAAESGLQRPLRRRADMRRKMDRQAGGILPCSGVKYIVPIEMVCDWWAARKGYNDLRPWRESVELNFTAKSKHLSAEQLWLARDVADYLARYDEASGSATSTS